MKDERIVQARREIQSTAYNWIVLLLCTAVFVQFFFMNAPFTQYAVELFLLVGIGFYDTISNLQKGIDLRDPYGEGKKPSLLGTMATVLAATVCMVILSGEHDAESFVVYLVTSFVFLFAFPSILHAINDRKQRKIDRELDEEEGIESFRQT